MTRDESSESHLMAIAESFGVPIHLRWPLVRYALYGVPVGDFLTACLANDFCGAVVRADKDEWSGLKSVALFIRNELPSGIVGDRQAVQAWTNANAEDRLKIRIVD